MSSESKKSIISFDQKILLQFKQYEKNFTEKSEPIFFDNTGEKISLKKIYNLESVDDKPISMIAVTRHQYDTDNFSTYRNYIQNDLKFERFYYGLWPDEKENKVEYDVLYVIPTNNNEKVQDHLNSHNHMNNGQSQAMALVIFADGSSEIIENSRKF
jgi:hypothetical protein